MVEPTPSEFERPPKNHTFDAMAALVTAWIRPATTTRRTNQAPLPIAFAAHCVAAFAFVLSIVLIDALFWYRNDDYTLLERWMNGCEQLVHDCFRYPFDAAIVVFGCEAGLIGIAMLMAAWGAKDERFAESIRHSIRRTWLHCGHVVAITLIAGGATALWIHAERWHQRKIEGAMSGLTFPDIPGNGTQAEIEEYNRKVEAYRYQYAAIERQLPHSWFIRHGERLTSLGFVAGVIWFLAALMRGVAADRPHRRQPDLLVCRECGYNLIATDPDSRCPECGRPVRLSLARAPEAAPPWQRVTQPRRLPWAFVRTVWRASTQSTQLAFGLRNLPGSNRFRWYLGVNLILSAVVSYSILYFVFAPDQNKWIDLIWIVAPWLVVLWVSALLLLLLLCAFIVGIAIRVRTGRNQLAAVNQLACYLSGYLVSFTLIVGVFIAATAHWNELFQALCRDAGISADALIFAGFGTLILILCVRLWFRLWRASAGVRYLTSPATELATSAEDAPDNVP